MKLIKLFLLQFFFTNAFAQPKTITVYFEGKQPSSQLNVLMKYHKEIGATGQQFGIQIQNLTSNKIEVTGNYFANLVNGNVKDKSFTILIKPNAIVGGNGIFTDVDISETVFPEDCKAVNNTRIKNVGFRISGVVDLTALENKKKSDAEQKNKQYVDRINQNEKDKQAIIERNIQINNQKKEELRQKQEIQQKIDILQKDYDRKLKNTEVVGNIVTTGLETIFAIAEKKRQREENERELRSLRAKQEELEKELKQKQDEQNNEKRQKERDRVKEVYATIIENIQPFGELNSITKNLNLVYVISLSINEEGNHLFANCIKINKYSDNTWPLSYFENMKTKHFYYVKKNKQTWSTLSFFGYYETETEMITSLKNIKQKAEFNNVQMLQIKEIYEINPSKETIKKQAKSFWEEN